jgi:D-alanyl-D-alanine carboxypeptidase/D-alanyl-D-alanine-endopeptidase (penicillin-binding protein 4)
MTLRSGVIAGLAVLASACGPAGGPPTPARAPLQALRFSIDSLAADPAFANAHLGILIVNPATGDTLYSRNAGKMFMPASNQKVLTTAVALTQLGPDFRYETIIAARGRRGSQGDSILNGDIIVIGNGDPTISNRVRGSAEAAMDSIADAIRMRGIRRVSGSIRQGGDAFPDSIYGYGWEWDDLKGSSGAPVDELLFNEGMVQRPTRIDGRDTTVSVATRTPGFAYLSALYLAMSRKGIVVDGGVDLAIDSLTAPYDTLYSFQSPPLREIAKHFMKPSQNQIGEVLLKTLGLARTGVGTADSGAAVVTRQLREWGVDSMGAVVYDGSGLSRHNLVSPETLIRTLVAMMRDSATFDVFYESFPIAGVDGTVRNRMRETPAANNLRGKTGTLEFVRSLSGYVSTADDQLLVYSLLSNHFTVPVSRVTRLQDAIGVLLANYRGSP